MNLWIVGEHYSRMRGSWTEYYVSEGETEEEAISAVRGGDKSRDVSYGAVRIESLPYCFGERK